MNIATFRARPKMNPAISAIPAAAKSPSITSLKFVIRFFVSV